MKASLNLNRSWAFWPPSWSNSVKCYFQLTKPKIALLLLISTAAGMLASDGGSLPLLLGIEVLLGGYLCAGGAAAMNCYLDRELDMTMSRTRNRPLPSGQVTPTRALVFGTAISLLSVPIFLLVSPLVMLLGIVAWVYYVLFYSIYLKRRTTQNIVVGGAAGAFPPLIGWTAVAGSIEVSAIFLFLIVFFWTPPHAYALMLVLKNDYERAKIPMLPVVKGDKETGRQIILYGFVLVGVTIIPASLGLFGFFYLATAIVLGVGLLALAIKLYYSLDRLWALRVFRYSSMYLALLFIGLVLDRGLFT